MGTPTSEKPTVPAKEMAQPEESTSELAAYRNMVATVAAAADGRVIVNRSEAHAAVVIEHVIKSAKQQIDILTGELHRPIYGDDNVVASAVNFFKANPQGTMRILSERPVSEDHPFLAALASVRDRIDLRIMSAAEKTPKFHLAVADGKSFRFEPDKNKYEAFGQFGEPVIGEKLKSAFERLHNAAPAA